ncbi:hypothetical protein [Candidatus Nitrosocosmicus hydrocola]|uniref:hypothetical protein n=1 Tax=Candidatus Nitrosocosmicus hydrocola TaxID=1826872 RepID=UPI0011E5CEC4|nr:hypothetical protein [Candidatus Nitrosocosmicus hydrocola]
MTTIPSFIKIKVLKLWILGIPRDMVAHSLGIGTGSVSRIIRDIKLYDIPDLDLLREIGKILREHGLGMNDFIDTIRMNGYLSDMGISTEQVEILLEQIHIQSYRNGEDIEKFLKCIDYL